METEYKGKISDYKWSENDVFSLDNTIVLKKKKDQDFIILNITDPHFADYDYRSILPFESIPTIKRLVKKVQPDLITVTGDIVCTKSTVGAVKRFTDVMRSFGVPWAPVFGNHDDEGNCDLNYLSEVMMSDPNCVMQKGDPDMGVGNYLISIVEEGTDNLVEEIVMLDSHHSQANEIQQKWFKWVAEGVKKISNTAEVSLFMHIPLPEYDYALKEAWTGPDKNYIIKIKDYWDKKYNARGRAHESVACERDANKNPVQRGFFEIIKNTENTKYIFCGHEHMNNFTVDYQGVRLTYTMKLGFGSGFQWGYNGGTVITVGSGGITNIKHKIKLLGGLADIVNLDTK